MNKPVNCFGDEFTQFSQPIKWRNLGELAPGETFYFADDVTLSGRRERTVYRVKEQRENLTLYTADRGHVEFGRLRYTPVCAIDDLGMAEFDVVIREGDEYGRKIMEEDKRILSEEVRDD